MNHRFEYESHASGQIFSATGGIITINYFERSLTARFRVGDIVSVTLAEDAADAPAFQVDINTTPNAVVWSDGADTDYWKKFAYLRFRNVALARQAVTAINQLRQPATAITGMRDGGLPATGWVDHNFSDIWSIKIRNDSQVPAYATVRVYDCVEVGLFCGTLGGKLIRPGETIEGASVSRAACTNPSSDPGFCGRKPATSFKYSYRLDAAQLPFVIARVSKQ